MARAVSSGTISFGMVSIPVKFFVACKEENVHFNQFTSNGNRVKQKYVDAVSGETVERNSMLKGYEYSKGQYVVFTREEIKALEEQSNGTIDIKEFVPGGSVDLLHVEKTYYVGPGKGGDKAYLLLSKALKSQDKYAVAQWTNRGHQHLVIIRPYKEGLIIHQMFYSNEVREFECDAAKLDVSDIELQMANQLIDSLSKDSYSPEQYSDSYAERVAEAVDKKLAGETLDTIRVKSEEPSGNLLEALKASLSAA